ncbi:hypothetical protein BC939DRAFT_146850 [Gamsiella multidivaricata]|uniref:uncharacterized protein n=1 Tax=Gamsiella multidivaricata TaxID=101098 RepID=UPI00221EC7A1|nr:uncharacterized protein BC939DRAFT_146850 [Gamsiella multidivaricata]KAG0359958.1 hypothetical protein BGZ54_009759 [Gamsiella multidivaricata]KAI7831672.1 hypothetical protein BC939DRAFT_146850 [Gamsiella multidivaricata]
MTFRNPNDGSTYVVKYMNLMGRAAIVRTILHLAGAEYKNEFVEKDAVGLNRAAYPFGHVPVLIETRADGTAFELAETIAIEHYLAEKFGLLSSSSPQEVALQKSVAFNIFFELYQHCFLPQKPIQETIQDPISELRTKVLPQFIHVQERWLNKNGNNGHYFGDRLSYPDLVLLNWVRVLEAIGYKWEDEASPIKKLEATVKAMPEWKGQFDAFHPFNTL